MDKHLTNKNNWIGEDGCSNAEKSNKNNWEVFIKEEEEPLIKEEIEEVFVKEEPTYFHNEFEEDIGDIARQESQSRAEETPENVPETVFVQNNSTSVGRGKQVQRRWKNLRECFRRELKAQKGRSGDGATNKRKYVYFDQLLFLARTFNERETTGNYSAPKGNDDEERGESETPSNSTNVDIPERAYKQKKIHGCSNNRYEEELIEILREKSKGDCDEDKAFVMSLLPKFKKFNDEQRFEAQLEIMKVMRRVQLMPTQVQSTAYHGNVPSTSNFQPYVAAPGMSQHTQTDLLTNNIQHMHQHQIGEGHHPTQELVHVRGYLHYQPHQPQLHH